MKTFPLEQYDIEELNKADVQSPVCLSYHRTGTRLIMGVQNTYLVAGWWKPDQPAIEIQWQSVRDVVIPEIWDWF